MGRIKLDVLVFLKATATKGLGLHVYIVVLRTVIHKLLIPVESMRAIWLHAFVHFILDMPSMMLLSVATGAERFGTELALVRPLSRMRPLMHLKVRFISKDFTTNSLLSIIYNNHNLFAEFIVENMKKLPG